MKQDFNSSDYTGKEILQGIEVSLPKYTNHIFELFHAGFERETSGNGLVLDFGSGKGTLAKLWRSHTGISPKCVEIDNELIEELKLNDFEVVKDLDSLNCKFDFIYTSNVLEHIEHDIEMLKNLKNVMTANGILCIYVPAFPILFSKLDKNVGHFRRYRKKSLLLMLESCGYEVRLSRYCDVLGFLSTLILKSFGFTFNIPAGGTKLMKLYDSFIFPISILLDKFAFKYLFGKNLYVVVKNLT